MDDFLRIVTDDVATSPGHETVLLRYTNITDAVTVTVFTTTHRVLGHSAEDQTTVAEMYKY